jgi:hypothetical protein
MHARTFSATGRDLQYDVHPDFSTSIYPVGSIDAIRFVFHLCFLLPLTNNHIRLLFMRSAIYYTVILDIWPCTLWYAGLYSTYTAHYIYIYIYIYISVAFIQV